MVKTIGLYCRKCDYRFEKDKIPVKCPYCSAEGSVEVQKSAQDILDEVEEVNERRGN